MIDARIDYLLPILHPALAVHYTEPDDLAFLQWWTTYLRDHDRVAPSVRTTVIDPYRFAPPRLVVTVRDGHSDRGDILRLGQSLILHNRKLRVLDTDTLPKHFRKLTDLCPATEPQGATPPGRASR